MLNKTEIIYSLYVMLLLYGLAYSNQWNGIVPLESTRADVEKILGNPKPESKFEDRAFYKTKGEKVFVFYSIGDCNNKQNNGWNISKGKVIRFTVYPIEFLTFDDYKFDENKFKKYIDQHNSYTAYVNDEDGFYFLLDTDYKKIVHFEYYPKSNDNYLKCSEKF